MKRSGPNPMVLGKDLRDVWPPSDPPHQFICLTAGLPRAICLINMIWLGQKRNGLNVGYLGCYCDADSFVFLSGCEVSDILKKINDSICAAHLI